MHLSKELVAASATPLVLSVLSQGDSYGYAIIKRVSELTEGEVQWSDGMLYPVLHRLEKQGHIVSEWKKAETGRRRKYYRLEPGGLATLKEEKKKWTVLNNALSTLWEEKPCLI
ncbi:helix-turn-helix transcriptional regulator [Pontiellaceae bacterium B1224]|nr:helix-turn-helix transcriptional regulator [Pontiellaceae bacterium B1224]